MTQNVRNKNTQTFVIETVSVEFVRWQDRFLKNVIWQHISLILAMVQEETRSL